MQFKPETITTTVKIPYTYHADLLTLSKKTNITLSDLHKIAIEHFLRFGQSTIEPTI